MKALPKIHKEHFEFWLFSQPDEREFDYGDCAGCVGATFMLEAHRIQTLWGNITYSLKDYVAVSRLPDWLHQFLYGAFQTHGGLLFVADLKEDWRKLFPEPFPAARQEQTAMDDARMGPCSSVAEGVRA